MRSRTARVMTTLMRNGRDRRSENPSGPTRYLSACCCPGPISGSHQGQQPLRLHRNRGNPPSENRPYTWLHPNASQKVRFALAPRAPSIHGPFRPFRQVAGSVVIGVIADIGRSAQNDAVDPSRHFATVICRTAKDTCALDVGGSGRLQSLAGQERGRASPLATLSDPDYRVAKA